MAIQDDICEAIRNRSVVTFTYKFKTRTVEPHILGYDSDGDLTLSAWQIVGGSGQGFRDFHVRKISAFSTTLQSFANARKGYNPNDQTLSRIVCRL